MYEKLECFDLCMDEIKSRPPKLKIHVENLFGKYFKNISSKYELHPTESKYILPKVASSPYLKHRPSDIEDLSQ